MRWLARGLICLCHVLASTRLALLYLRVHWISRLLWRTHATSKQTIRRFWFIQITRFFFRVEPNKKKRMCFFRVRVCSCSKHFSECILCNRHIKQIVWSKSNKKSKETAKYKQLLNLGRTLLPCSLFCIACFCFVSCCLTHCTCFQLDSEM